jgi:hypothetical protein
MVDMNKILYGVLGITISLILIVALLPTGIIQLALIENQYVTLPTYNATGGNWYDANYTWGNVVSGTITTLVGLFGILSVVGLLIYFIPKLRKNV